MSSQSTVSHIQPKVHYLKDYIATDFLIDSVWLHFNIHDEWTEVKSVMKFRANPALTKDKRQLILSGENMELKRVVLDGQVLNENAYQVNEENLIVDDVPNEFVLETDVVIQPHLNTQLCGLYKSRTNYCTQCESHGFRKITYFYDRPDILTHFTTTISADKEKLPILLSNGNLVEEKILASGRHWIKWEDPSLKPCYLFALVAGDFDLLQDSFVTMSGREVALRLYVEKGYLDQADFAMVALKRSMKWDEETFGREYDLDIFMIVAVSDFNMGAMENKGLNIFNTKCILAHPNMATDNDYTTVQDVIGHEYFHNWSGNRVTVRDWFQLTLKEGLTILRDQLFTEDLVSSVHRIDEVGIIRNVQFAEDAGPMAHPIRPDEYINMDNFYTVTVYNKGAEVIRMIRTMLGKQVFRKAMDLYFERNDGKAVTCEDFVQAMQDSSGKDLTQFKRWYGQAGTPQLDISGDYNEVEKTFSLTIKQSCPATPKQGTKLPFHIPVAVALLDHSGNEMKLVVDGKACESTTYICELTDEQQTYVFSEVEQNPTPSILRGFSAPVKYDYPYSDDDLLFLWQHDTDAFNQWDAGQRYLIRSILKNIKLYQANQAMIFDEKVVAVFSHLLKSDHQDKILLSRLLSFPTEKSVISYLDVIEPEAIYSSILFIKHQLAEGLASELLATYERYDIPQEYIFNAEHIGQRNMRNVCLYYIGYLNAEQGCDLAYTEYENASNMSDKMGALSALNICPSKLRDQALNHFFEEYKDQPLVVDKWLSLHATASFENTLEIVKSLLDHPAYDSSNPNKIRALVGIFCFLNMSCFHDESGKGYEFLAEQIIKIDAKNPQVAARLFTPFLQWKRFDKMHQELMRRQIERLQQHNLSSDVYELVEKSLAES